MYNDRSSIFILFYLFVMKLLRSDPIISLFQRRSAESCVLYFIPSTLQNMPEAFEVMKDVILSQLTLASPREDQEVNHNWHRNRKRLLYGYCALLRIARKRGLASFADVVRA